MNKLLILSAVIVSPLLYLLFYALFSFLVLSLKIQNYLLLPLQYLVIPLFVMFFWLIDAGRYIFFSYFLLAGIASIFSIVYLWNRKKSKVFRYVPFYYFAVAFLLLLFFIVSGYFITNGTYIPALQPKQSIRYQVIDYPKKGLDNIYNQFLIQFEGVDNKYEVIGWIDNKKLVYKKFFGGRMNTGGMKTYVYDTIGSKSIEYIKPLDNLYKKTCTYKECISEIVETSYSAVHGCFTAYISPDSKNYACVASYTYGPQDLMIFTP